MKLELAGKPVLPCFSVKGPQYREIAAFVAAQNAQIRFLEMARFVAGTGDGRFDWSGKHALAPDSIVLARFLDIHERLTLCLRVTL